MERKVIFRTGSKIIDYLGIILLFTFIYYLDISKERKYLPKHSRINSTVFGNGKFTERRFSYSINWQVEIDTNFVDVVVGRCFEFWLQETTRRFSYGLIKHATV